MKKILAILLLICFIPFGVSAEEDWDASLTNTTGRAIESISVYRPGGEEENILTETLRPDEGIMLSFPGNAVNDAAILALGLEDFPMMKFLIHTDEPADQIILAMENDRPYIQVGDQATDPFFLVASDPVNGGDMIVTEYPGYEESLSYEYPEETEEFEQDETVAEEEAPQESDSGYSDDDWEEEEVSREPMATPVPLYKNVKIHIRNRLTDDITEVYMRPTGKRWSGNMMYADTYIGIGDRRVLPYTIRYRPGTRWDIYVRTQGGGWASFSGIRIGNVRDPWNLTLTITRKSGDRYRINIK